MGSIAETLKSPEWAGKSPLERARARQDLFALTLEGNPGFKQEFLKSDAKRREKLREAWQEKMEADFPEAWSVAGHDYEKSLKGKVEAVRGRSGVYNIGTEELLERLRSRKEGNAALEAANRRIEGEALDAARRRAELDSMGGDGMGGMGGMGMVEDAKRRAEKLRESDGEY
jgi:hypothetical protein